MHHVVELSDAHRLAVQVIEHAPHQHAVPLLHDQLSPVSQVLTILAKYHKGQLPVRRGRFILSFFFLKYF